MDHTDLIVSLLAVAPGNIAVLDSDLRFLRVNTAMAGMAGLSPEEAAGLPLAEVLPGLTPTLVPLLLRVLHGGSPIQAQEVTGEIRGSPGRLHTFRVSCQPVCGVAPPGGSDAPVQGIVVALEEVSSTGAAGAAASGALPDATPDGEGEGDARPMSEEIRGLVLETANRIATDILSSQTGRDALHRIAEVARTLAGARYAALGVANPDGGLQDFITAGMTPKEEAAIGDQPQGRGILGLLLTRQDPLHIDDLGHHPSSVGFPPNHPPMHGFLGVPIRQGDAIVGSLYLAEKENGRAFTEADVAAVATLGAHAAVAIQNLHLLRRQRALLAGIIHAQEAERRAVAYELHDGLTQYVMASHIHFDMSLTAREAGEDGRASEQFRRGFALLKEAVVESRRLVNGLRTLVLDDLGLAGALAQLLVEEKNRAGWETAELDHNLGSRRFDNVLETTAYRVAQEALTNARKHAQADTVSISLHLTDGGDPRTGADLLTLEVRDAGVGFSVAAQMSRYGHLGLHSMSERVQLLGGTYELHSAPGAGTIVRATFPVLNRENAQT